MRSANWMNAIRYRKFYLKLLLVVGMVGLLPVFLANILSYYTVINKFKEETMAGNEKLLIQSVGAMELVLQEVENSSRQFLNSKIMQTFESFTNSDLYEGYSDEEAALDPINYYNYFRIKEDAIGYLDTFRLNHDFVESVYYYDSIRNQVLDFESSMPLVKQQMDKFEDKAWLNSLKELNPLSATILGTRVVSEGVQRKYLMTLLMRTNYANNALAINFDAGRLFNNTFKNLDSADHFYVLDENKRIIITDDVKMMFKPWEGSSLPNRSLRVSSSVYEGKEGKQLLTFVYSQALPWTFVYESDYDRVLQGANSVKQTVVFSAGLLLLIMLLIVIVSTIQLYRPVQRILNVFRLRQGADDADEHAGSGDEFQRIVGWMRNALTQKEDLADRLTEALPLYREQFKLSLLKPHNRSLEQLLDKMSTLQIELRANGGCLVVLVEIEPSQEQISKSNLFEEEVRMMALKELIEASSCNGAPFEMVTVNPHRLGLIVQVNQEQVLPFITFFQNCAREWNAEAEIYSIGISRYCAGLLELPAAYAEAREAIEYKRILGIGAVVSIDEVSMSNVHAFAFPRNKAELVYRYVKLGDESGAVKALQEFYAELDDSRLPFEQNQSHFVQLLTGLIEDLTEIGVQSFASGPDNGNVYQALLARTTVPDMKKWLETFVRAKCETVTGIQNEEDENHIQKLMDLMKREPLKNVTLNTVAAQLQLNPAYLSRLFKQQTGQHFGDYLKQFRIESSKRLLEENNMQIQQVAEEVGYSHTYYFIRVFKEIVGITPGEYKKLLRK